MSWTRQSLAWAGRRSSPCAAAAPRKTRAWRGRCSTGPRGRGATSCCSTPPLHSGPRASPVTGKRAWDSLRKRSTRARRARGLCGGPESRRSEDPHEVRGLAATSRGPLEKEETDDVLSRLVLAARQDLQRRRDLMGSAQLELAGAASRPEDVLGALRTP